MNSKNKNKKTEVDTEIVNPFERRESLPRTPPRMRTYSLPDPETNEEGICINTDRANKQKRKRTELTPGDEAETKAEIRFKHVLEAIIKQVKALEKEVRGSYKLKNEIVEISYKLAYQTALLQSEEMQSLDLDKSTQIRDKAIDEKLELVYQRENQKLKNQIKALEIDRQRELEKRSLIPINQCEECKKASKKAERRREVTGEKELADFQRITEDDWSDEIFPRVKIQHGPIWEAPAGTEIILPCNRDFESDNRAVGIAINKFGGKEGLKTQNKAKGEVAMMSHSLGFPDDNGDMTYSTRNIYYPIVDNEMVDDADDRVVFQCLKTIKEHLLKNNKTNIAVPESDNVGGTVMKRMLEFLFADTTICVSVFKLASSEQTVKRAKAPRTFASVVSHPGPKNKPTGPKPETIRVQMKDKTYSDILKAVKRAVNPDQIGVDVGKVAKLRNGDLILTIRNGSDKAEVLKREIGEKLPEATTSLLTKKKVLHIKGMDEIATKEEVKEAVVKAIAVNPESFEIRALRPAYGGKQNVTIVIKENDGKKLVEMESIKIGWVRCKIIERKKDMRCYRCWEPGHMKQHCTGPDREKLCMKCGKEGHKASSCANEPFCVHCKSDGHQAGSAKCKTRVAVIRDNNGQQQNTTNTTNNESS